MALIKLTTTSSTCPSALRSQHPSPSPHSRLLYVRSKLKEASCDYLILATEKCVFNAGLNPAFSSSLIMLSTAYIRNWGNSLPPETITVSHISPLRPSRTSALSQLHDLIVPNL